MRSLARWSWLAPLLMAACIVGEHRHAAHRTLDGHLEYPDADVAPPDLAQPRDGGGGGGGGGGGTFGCNGLLGCLSGCSDDVCANACLASTTPQGQSLFFAASACMDQACPRTATTDPCSDPASTACDACLQAAQTGACAPSIDACFNDLP
jgi:hypothetical protein